MELCETPPFIVEHGFKKIENTQETVENLVLEPEKVPEKMEIVEEKAPEKIEVVEEKAPEKVKVVKEKVKAVKKAKEKIEAVESVPEKEVSETEVPKETTFGTEKEEKVTKRKIVVKRKTASSASVEQHEPEKKAHQDDQLDGTIVRRSARVSVTPQRLVEDLQPKRARTPPRDFDQTLSVRRGRSQTPTREIVEPEQERPSTPTRRSSRARTPPRDLDQTLSVRRGRSQTPIREFTEPEEPSTPTRRSSRARTPVREEVPEKLPSTPGRKGRKAKNSQEENKVETEVLFPPMIRKGEIKLKDEEEPKPEPKNVKVKAKLKRKQLSSNQEDEKEIPESKNGIKKPEKITKNKNKDKESVEENNAEVTMVRRSKRALTPKRDFA